MNDSIQQTETAILVELADLADSPYQKPRVSDRGKVDELAISMREVGVLNPLIARARIGHKGERYELVAGHRRKRAAARAELSTVPVFVREYTDDQVLEIIAVENGQREGVHPLDEADLFVQLVKRGKSIEHIADRVGRPASFVRARLQLEHLEPEAREAFDAGRLLLGPALQIARIPDRALQLEALGEVAADPEDDHDEGMSAKRAGEYIRDRFMLRLANAPFATDDAALVDEAGPCTTCPKRTGNQTELFDDVDSPDVCTDPACFRGKVDAHWAQMQKRAKREGKKVLPDKEAAALWHEHSESTVYGTAWLTTDSTTYLGNKSVRVGALLKGQDVEVTLARNPHSGKLHELVPRKVVEKIAQAKSKEAAKVAAKKGTAKETPAQKAAREKTEHARAVEDKARELCLAAVVAKVEALGEKADEAIFALIVRDLADNRGAVDEAFERRGVFVGAKAMSRHDVEGYAAKYLKDASGHQLRAFVAECVLSMQMGKYVGKHAQQLSQGFCRALGVDAPDSYGKRAEAAVKAEAEAKVLAQDAATAPAASKKASKAKPGKKGARR